MAPKIAQPWRWLPAYRPNVKVSENGTANIRIISTKFVSGVGFSKGCAELALRKPPPLLPSSLMTSWDAIGPRAIVCWAPCRVVAAAGALRVWGMPCHTKKIATTTAIGRRTYRMPRVRSTQ